MNKRWVLPILILLIMGITLPAQAQTATPTPGPIYIVQEGDTLTVIAYRFNIRLDDLMDANDISDADWITPGQELLIPGYEDLSGYLITEVVPFGESLRSMSRSSGNPDALIKRLNRIVSPTEIYAGVHLVVLKQNENAGLNARSSLNCSLIPFPG
jgi:LysM repeat protein